MTTRIFCLWILIFGLLLSGCTTISRSIQNAGNTRESGYPAAKAKNRQLEKPLTINLSRYKSVQTRLSQRSDVAVAFAASGGGYRAANLTLGVLLGLEKLQSKALKGNMLQEVDYFSTVSGGGFGVGYYIARLQEYFLQNSNLLAPFSLQSSVNEMFAGNTENPLRMDLTEHLFFGQQRGLGLEKTLNDSLLKTSKGDLTLGDIFIPVQSPAQVQLPYWTTNSTIYQNAAILPFSPDILARYQVTGYYHDGTLYNLPPEFNSPSYATSVPVSVGLTASATVPFALPATTLVAQGCDTQCYLQLFDGGLADNLGVYTALSFLLQDKSKIKILIVVDAYKGTTEPYSQIAAPPNSVSLLWRVMTASTDSNREHIEPNIRFVARDLMCGNGATNVVVIYLDLSHYPEAQRIGTQLNMTADDQKLLVQIGEELVEQDATFKAILAQLERGKLTLGQCKKK